jgi:hypothetical protein
VRRSNRRPSESSKAPKDNLTGAERRALRSSKANGALTVIRADEGNSAVVLDTSDNNRKFRFLLEDNAYKKLKKDPTDSVERKIVLFLKRPRITEVSQ